jgi:hypothetical protein
MQTARFSFALGALVVSLFAQAFFNAAECAWPDKPITVYVGHDRGRSQTPLRAKFRSWRTIRPRKPQLNWVVPFMKST